MRIWITLWSILNYIYNNLIDLVWTKKIRFADGTEMDTVPNGNDLYDIKLLSQAIADKGFAFMCHNTTRFLSKDNVATIYNDIFQKYLDSDKIYNSGVVASSGYKVRYDSYDGKFYFFDGTSVLNYSTNADLSNPQVLTLPEFTESYFDIVFGENVNVILTSRYTDNHWFYVYDKNWNFIDKVNVYSYDLSDFRFCKKVGNGLIWGFSNDDPYAKKCIVFKFDDNTAFNYQVSPYYNIGQFNNSLICYRCSDLYGDYFYLSCLGGGNGWEFITLRININNLSDYSLLNYPNMDSSSVAGTEVKLTEIVKYNGQYYVGYAGKIYKYTAFQGWELFKTVGDCYRIAVSGQNFYILFDNVIKLTRDFSNYTTVITYNLTVQYITYFYADNNVVVYSCATTFDYVYADVVPMYYTDSYTINETLITIDYYKFNDFKICISDNGGTNDTNLKTLFDYLGYCNYWLLNITDETICLQRNKQNYVAMFVGDNFVDDTSDLDNNPTRALPQEQEIFDDSANVSLDVKGNVGYNLTSQPLSSLTINSYENSPLGTTIRFKSGATATTITDNTNIDWVDGATPIPSTNVECLIFVWNNIGFYKEW